MLVFHVQGSGRGGFILMGSHQITVCSRTSLSSSSPRKCASYAFDFRSQGSFRSFYLWASMLSVVPKSFTKALEWLKHPLSSCNWKLRQCDLFIYLFGVCQNAMSFNRARPLPTNQVCSFQICHLWLVVHIHSTRGCWRAQALIFTQQGLVPAMGMVNDY